VRIRCLCHALDRGAASVPECVVSAMQRHAAGIDAHRTIETFAQNFGVSSVTSVTMRPSTTASHPWPPRIGH
jgi:hypothetical protein